MKGSFAHHCPDDRIQTGTIAPARQHTDFHYQLLPYEFVLVRALRIEIRRFCLLEIGSKYQVITLALGGLRAVARAIRQIPCRSGFR
jgi:hypothetical protein